MKRFFTFLSVLVALFLVASCGPDGGGSKTNEIPELSDSELRNLTAEVTFWHAMGQAKSAIIEEMVTQFNKFYPNITVTIASQGGYDDLRDKVNSSFRTGGHPTLAQVYPDHVSLYLQGEGVRELNSYVNHAKYGLTQAQYADYIPAYLGEGMIFDDANTLYSLPFNKSSALGSSSGSA